MDRVEVSALAALMLVLESVEVVVAILGLDAARLEHCLLHVAPGRLFIGRRRGGVAVMDSRVRDAACESEALSVGLDRLCFEAISVKEHTTAKTFSHSRCVRSSRAAGRRASTSGPGAIVPHTWLE